MKRPVTPSNETERIAALKRYDVLDTDAEQAFDDLTALAAHIFNVPIALVSFIDETRQWFKSHHGLDATETPREVSFCGHAVAESNMLVVPDTFEDERFADNPLVTGDPRVRFYAGAPLTTPEGFDIGTLCVIDHKAYNPTPEQLNLLQKLARQVISQLELRLNLSRLTEHAVEVEEEVDRLAETLKQQKELRLAQTTFFNTSLDLLCVANTDGYFLHLNAPWENLLGWSIEELKSKPFTEYIHPDDRAATIEEAARLESEGYKTISFENRYMVKGGGYRWLSWNATAEPNERAIYAIARDITDQKSVAEERKRLAQIIENSSDFVGIADQNYRPIYVNETGRRLLGLADGDPLPNGIADFHTAEASKELARVAFPQAIAEGSWMGESALVDRDGTEIPVLSLIQAHRDSRGKLSRLSMHARDISERKKIEDMKNEFVSVVSHELRTPLTSIRGSLGLLKGGAAGDLPEKAQSLIDIASTNTERLVRLINDILDLEKIEAGKMTLHLENLSTDRLVQSAAECVAGMATERGIKIKIGDTTRTVLRADGDRLVQVLTNLLSNAIKFSPAGASVLVSAEDLGDRARISVSDNGPGIKESDIARVFDRFQQLDASDTRMQGGTGLGLAIARAIVLEHDGEMGVNSTVGDGSTFWFDLPVQFRSPDVASESPLPAIPNVGGSQYTVMIVEDDEHVATVLRLLISREGYDSVVAYTLADARKKIAESPPDAILLDVKLPDGNGLDFLQELKDSGDVLPTIVVTGQDRNEDTSQLPSLVDWLPKPVDDKKLLSALRLAVRSPGPPRALVVEDDPHAAEVICRTLETMGLTTDCARDGHAAVEMAETHIHDLIVLDVGLPGRDGFDIVEYLRRTRSRNTPLLVYTGRDLDATERRALTLGLTRHLIKTRSSEQQFLSTVTELLNDVLSTAERTA